MHICMCAMVCLCMQSVAELKCSGGLKWMQVNMNACMVQVSGKEIFFIAFLCRCTYSSAYVVASASV